MSEIHDNRQIPIAKSIYDKYAELVQRNAELESLLREAEDVILSGEYCRPILDKIRKALEGK